ncbi:MAG TPA: hypothetical protein VIK18_16765 [Pirellulales bacterium]
MPSICTCPDCHERVLVESLADAALRLRCPLCSGTFEIAAVSAAAEPAPPWALPLLDEEAVEVEPAVEFAGDREPVDVHEHHGSADAIEVPAEGFAEDHPLSIGEIAAAADHGPAAVDQADPEAWMPASGDADRPPSDEMPSDGTPTDEPAAVWNAMGEHAADLGSPSRARRREPQIGVIGNLIGVVLGGVVGIGLGYFILLWVAGRQGDFLHIWDQMPRILLPSEHVEP